MLITLKVNYDKNGKATNELDPNVQSFLFRNYGDIKVKTVD